MHSFHKYLLNSENWIYRIISGINDYNIYINSMFFLKCKFYNEKFHYCKFPPSLAKLYSRDYKSTKIKKIIRTTIKRMYKWRFIRCIKKNDIKLIHSHFGNVGWFDYLNSKKLQIKRVISFYGLDYEYLPFKNPKWIRNYKILFKHVDCFICEGQHGANILKSLGCTEKKIKILHLGVDIDKVPYFNRNKKPKSLKLIQISGYAEKKGINYTFRAFLKALKECPNMTLTFVGNDDIGRKDNLKKLIKEIGIEDKISILNAIDFSELYNFMADYHVFIHPSCYTRSRNCEGGAPVVLLDAQATGMPVISTFHCDIPEVVIHKKTGLLSPEKKVNQIAEYIKKFYLMDQSEYNEFSLAARKHIEENYNIKNTIKKLINIYEEILNKD
ncbi:MAG: glycosyltransferase [Promethearchaeota archaeon]